MRLSPDPFRLSFLLPEGANLERALALYAPACEGCSPTIHAAGMVVLGGPSRLAVLADAGPFIKNLFDDRQPRSIAATLTTESQDGIPGGRDSYTVLLGAEVGFIPGAPAGMVLLNDVANAVPAVLVEA